MGASFCIHRLTIIRANSLLKRIVLILVQPSDDLICRFKLGAVICRSSYAPGVPDEAWAPLRVTNESGQTVEKGHSFILVPSSPGMRMLLASELTFGGAAANL